MNRIKSNFWRKGICVLCVLVFSSLIFVGAIFASDYPSKPIKLIVPYNAGGGTDGNARLIQKGLEKFLPQPLVIINMGGAASVIGCREVLNAEPDGYTILVNIVNIWTNKALGRADFGPFDFEPVAQAGTYYLVEVTGADSKYKNFNEYITDVKEKPNTVKEATNLGAITHFTSLVIQDKLGGDAAFKLIHIGDGAQRIANVLGGHVDATIMGTMEVKGYYDSGDMHLLAVYAPERLPGLENVTTAKEQGLDLEQAVSYWFFMPKGTPKDRVEYFADALEKTMQLPEIKEKMLAKVMVPSFLRGEELIKHIQEEGEKLMYIADKYNLKKSLTK